MPRVREFDFIVDAPPEEVARRLQEQTRFRLFSFQSSLLGTGKLGGRVSKSGFTVSLDDRQLVRRPLMEARGTLEARADGRTRVHGRIAFPTWILWTLRASVLILPVALLTSAIGVLGAAAIGPVLQFLALAAMVLSLLVISVGWQMNAANAQVEVLDARLTDAIQPERPTESAQHVRHRHAAMEPA